MKLWCLLIGSTLTACESAEAQVASAAVEQYEMAKRQGDKMQTCAQAGLVVAAYLQAQNEEEYRRWKAIEKTDCAAAGLEQ